METATRAALNAHLLLRQATVDLNAGVDEIQQNKLKIADLTHKNVLLVAEKQLLLMKRAQYDGDFGDDNARLRRELETKIQLLALLERELALLRGQATDDAEHYDNDQIVEQLM